MNPSDLEGMSSIGRWFDIGSDGKRGKVRVEVVHIKNGAKSGMNDFDRELSKEIDLATAEKLGGSYRIV
ncbi:hypothetical protein [Croceicoccus sp. Ery15]|uniref:hypothetical protein n=1 Tax=Croceicoccus sp. Ery15 TaxID=1703338 RepID=UPI001E383A05|nr:hypothetical protein [Croceicoccus sp. Ery15]